METLTFGERKYITAHIVANGEINYGKLIKYVNLDRSIDYIYDYVSGLETRQREQTPLTNAEKLILWTLYNRYLTPEQRRRMSRQLLCVKNQAAFEVECYEVFRRWFS